MESRLISASDGEVPVEHSQFVLQEVGGADAIEIGLATDDDTGVAVGGEGGVFFRSAANDHYGAVRIEVWSQQPPASKEDWDAVLDDVFTASSTGRLDLLGIFQMESTASEVVLPRPGRYHVRVHVAGREAVACSAPLEYPHGVERWLVQIWP